MKRILIIEDEEIAASRLVQMLKNLIPDAVFEGPLESVSQSVAFLTSNSEPSLIFLDIQLADGLSFNIFEKLKIHAPVIFTTAFDEYAIKAFELNSIDYLLKPIDQAKLSKSIDKIRHIEDYYGKTEDSSILNILKSIPHLGPKYRCRFLVNKGDTLIPLNTDDVAYFLAEDKIVLLYTHDGKKFIINYTLDSLEEQLHPLNFFRINRHCILNSLSIRKVHNYFNYKLKIEVTPPLTDELIVSKSRTSEFKEWLNQ